MRIPKIGTPVLDANLKEFGSISDIFGPVSHPFFSINPKKRSFLSSFAALVGEPVYTRAKDKRKKQTKTKQRSTNPEQVKNKLMRNQRKVTQKSQKNSNTNTDG